MMHKPTIVKLLKQGMTYSKIARRLNVTTPTVCYHAKRFGLSRQHQRAYASRNWSAIQRYYDQHGVMKTCKRFDVWQSTLKCAEKRGDFKFTRVRTTNEIISQFPTMGRAQVRRHILRRQLLPYVCNECGLAEVWNKRPLSLHLDHIDGQRSNHQLKNLRFLCPNCHSQTETYGGKNNRKT